MKYIYSILITLIGFTSSAQDPRLFENTWYLQNVIIDGQDNFPPSNDEVPYVPLLIYENNFLLETSVCNVGSGSLEFSFLDSSFFFTNGMTLTLRNCQNPNNSPYEGIYFWDFYNAGYLTINDFFQYAIVDNGNGGLILTITSPWGNEAIYGNEILSTLEVKDLRVTIYPNPTTSVLNIEGHSLIEKVAIYDL